MYLYIHRGNNISNYMSVINCFNLRLASRSLRWRQHLQVGWSVGFAIHSYYTL